MIQLTLPQARRFILGKSGLWPGKRHRGIFGAEASIREMRQLQLDPLKVAGRAHDLILQSRVADYRPEFVDQLAYGERKFFDWGSWLAMRPFEELPYWKQVMKLAAKTPRLSQWKTTHARAIREVISELRSRGPLGNRDFLGKRIEKEYRGGKDTSLALFYLWIRGDVFTHHREGFTRIYELRENVVPAQHDGEVGSQEALEFFAKRMIDVNGISGLQNLKYDLYRDLSPSALTRLQKTLMKREAIIPVQVAGEKKSQFVLAENLAHLQSIIADKVPDEWARETLVRTEDEVVFLSPLDPVSARSRAKRLFGFEYIWEVYKPLELRRWGYYVLPILWGDQLVGRIEPTYTAAGDQLRVLGFWLEDSKLAKDPRFGAALVRGLESFRKYAGGTSLRISGPGASQLKAILQKYAP